VESFRAAQPGTRVAHLLLRADDPTTEGVAEGAANSNNLAEVGIMKTLTVGTLVAALVIGVGALAFAQGPGGYWGGQTGGWGYGPMHMGPMMGGGYGMGPGMMGRGPGAAGFAPPCWGGPGAGYAPAGQPLTKDSATQILQSYVARIGNPNLKLGEVTETGTAFEGKIVTKDGSLVEKLVVDKSTGWVQQTF
jgi:hypothetical protein